jgi:hypothetical protein
MNICALRTGAREGHVMSMRTVRASVREGQEMILSGPKGVATHDRSVPKVVSYQEVASDRRSHHG